MANFPAVIINGYHCFDDWGCYLAHYEIGEPEPRLNRVEVAGRDGYIDFTERLRGRVIYSNREVVIDLLYVGAQSNWDNVYSNISRAIYGKKARVEIEQESHIIFGRCFLSRERLGRDRMMIHVNIDGNPYRVSKSPSYTRTGTIGAEAGLGNRVAAGIYVPRFVVTSAISSAFTMRFVLWGEGQVDRVYNVKFNSGTTSFDFDGDIATPDSNNTINFSFRVEEGSATNLSYTLTYSEAIL